VTHYARDNWASFASLAVIGLATLASWVLYSLSLLPAKGGPDTPAHEVIGAIHGVSMSRTNDSGAPNQLVFAERADQLRSGETRFIQPRFAMSQEQGAGVHLSADAATTDSQHKEIRLSGRVTLRQEQTPGSPAISLATESLIFSTTDNTAHTSDPVSVTQGRSQLQGTGLFVRLDKKDFKILSDTRMVIRDNTPQIDSRSAR